MPKEFVAESILKGLDKMEIRRKRILLARAKKGRDVLPRGLNKMGAEVDVVELYRAVKPKGGSKATKENPERSKGSTRSPSPPLQRLSTSSNSLRNKI